MSLKKIKKILPLEFFIVLGVVFIFLFFIATTLSITEIKKKGLQFRKIIEEQEIEKIAQLRVATSEEKKIKAKESAEKKGVLLAVSSEEIIMEMGKTEKNKGDKILAFVLDSQTLVILNTKTKEGVHDIVGTLEDLKIGQMVSVRGMEGADWHKAKIVRIFK